MTRDQLTAILTTTRTDALQLADGSYLDWSVQAGDGRQLEVGVPGGPALQLDLTADDLRDLVHRLAATLLAQQD